MTVHAKRSVAGVGRLVYAVSASDVLKADHPLNPMFVKWLDGKVATKRQATKFLQAYPNFREVKNG